MADLLSSRNALDLPFSLKGPDFSGIASGTASKHGLGISACVCGLCRLQSTSANFLSLPDPPGCHWSLDC